MLSSPEIPQAWGSLDFLSFLLLEKLGKAGGKSEGETIAGHNIAGGKVDTLAFWFFFLKKS